MSSKFLFESMIALFTRWLKHKSFIKKGQLLK